MSFRLLAAQPHAHSSVILNHLPIIFNKRFLLLPFSRNCGHLGGFFFFFKLARKPANTAATKTSSQRKHGFRRMRATISTSSGDPIRPLVTELLNINLLIGQGGKAAVGI